MEHIELKARKRLSSGQQHCHSSSDEDGQCERDEFLPMPLHSKRGEPSDHSGQVSLRKDITLCSGVALVAGQIIGSGIYVSPAIVLTYAGSFGVSLILWAVGALVAIFGSLCYVELGLLTRKSGGEFLYLVKAYSFRRSNGGVTVLGSLLGFISLWTDFCVARPSGLAVAVLLCAKYFIRPFFIGCCAPDLAVKCLAIAVLITICLINSLSVKVATSIITALSTIKILSLAFIVAMGVCFTLFRGEYPEVFSRPFQPRQGYDTTSSALALALYGVLWSFDGWNVMNYAIEETSNLHKTLPLSLVIGIPIVAVSYILVNMAYFAVLSYDQILSAEAVALPFGAVTMGTAGLVVIPIMVGISVFGSSTSSLLAGSRVTFSAARDGFLPSVFSQLHATYRTPLPAILAQGLMSSVLVWVGDITALIEGVGAATFLIYLLVIAGLIIMRVTYKEEPRLFKGWFIIPVACFMVILYTCLVFLPLLLKPLPSLMAFSAILLGVPVYLFLVMENPCRLRPSILDTISGNIGRSVGLLLNTKPTVNVT